MSSHNGIEPTHRSTADSWNYYVGIIDKLTDVWRLVVVVSVVGLASLAWCRLSSIVNQLRHGMESFPSGACERALSMQSFKDALANGDMQVARYGVKASRAKSLAFWKDYRKKHSALTDIDIRALQRKEAANRKRAKRRSDIANGVGTMGRLILEHEWRKLCVGDYAEEVWKNKLSFVPVVSLGRVGSENLSKLRKVNERLVEVVRLRGGASKIKRHASKTKSHQTGTSLGRTVVSGGRIPAALSDINQDVERPSGTIQFKKFPDATLQRETIEVVTDCVEEAFGSQGWYKAAKTCFAEVPRDRRLPHSSLPASNIWWSWKSHKSPVHIDTNVVPPCFVFCPYTYAGAELLCNGRKMPLDSGLVVGGSWHRFPHCNNNLLDNKVERYSFVVYFDYRMLNKSFLTK